MLATASPRVRCWPASTTANKARACARAKQPSNRPRLICKRQRQASKRLRPITPMPRRINDRRQTLLQSNTTSVETADTAKAAQDATLADVGVAQVRLRWRAPPSATPRRRATGSRNTRFSHAHVAVRRNGHCAAEGTRLGACRGRASVHADRSEHGLGARLYRREQGWAKSESASRPRSFCDRCLTSASRARSPASSPKAIASTKSVGSQIAFDPCRRTFILANRPRSTSRRFALRSLYWFRKQRSSGSAKAGNRLDSRGWTPCSSTSDARTPAARRTLRDHRRRPGQCHRGQSIA